LTKVYQMNEDEIMYFHFMNACRDGDLKTVESLLSKVDPSDNYNEAIQDASENGHVEVVRLLLTDDRVDPSDQHNHPIRWASSKGHIEVVRLLLADSRVNPTDLDNCAIRWASERGDVQMVKLLMDDLRVNPKGENWLYIDSNYACFNIVIFENPDAVCCVEDNDIESYIKDEELRMRYIQWQYRIGGEKWTKAKDCLK